MDNILIGIANRLTRLKKKSIRETAKPMPKPIKRFSNLRRKLTMQKVQKQGHGKSAEQSTIILRQTVGSNGGINEIENENYVRQILYRMYGYWNGGLFFPQN